jgi:hypothetical protein
MASGILETNRYRGSQWVGQSSEYLPDYECQGSGHMLLSVCSLFLTKEQQKLTMPPCMHRILSLTIPTGGMQLNVSENSFHVFILYRRLPV